MSTAAQKPSANQFTIGRLCWMVAQYALVFGVVSLLKLPVVALVIYLGSLTLALIAQRWLMPPRPEWPIPSRVGLYVAYYVTVAVIATVISFFLYIALGPHTPPSLGGAFGPGRHDPVWVLLLAMIYLGATSFLCTIGLLASLLSLHRSRLAWVFAVLNLPGTIYFGVLLFGLKVV